MKHNAKLNNLKQDYARINVTFVGPADKNGSHPVKRTDSIYVTTAEGEGFIKKAQTGISIK